VILLPSPALSQSATPKTPGKGYLLPQEQGLEMMVHIFGEVQKPGEYRVPDHTDVLELVAKAGGPTEYANLSWVKIRRVMPVQVSATRNVARLSPNVTVLDVNLKEAWEERSDSPPPRLVPGDVVVVSRNSWFGYRRLATVVRDLAVVASAYFLYLRVVED
jgi:protein involved in polysaccharide export with SLBB domain